MTSMLKIPRQLVHHILEDLTRLHHHAAERVGFLACRHTLTSNGLTLLGYDYMPVEDEYYMRDKTCGARIDGRAIRSAMEWAMAEKCTLLHVHTHGIYGQPEPSYIDKTDLPGIAESIDHVVPNAYHGWAVLSKDGIAGELLVSDKVQIEMRELSIVGNPMRIRKRPAIQSTFWQRLRKIKVSATRQSRQGFLGTESGKILSHAKIGIVGLCGGGSHVVQQLAHIGIKRFVLCDDDRIEDSNLNRLVSATMSDVRKTRLKTTIATRAIKSTQPICDIDAAPGRWQEKMDHLMDCDIIFGCIDSFQARRDLEAFCRRYFIPLIDVGMDVMNSGEQPEIYGQVALSLPGQPCLHCLGVLSEQSLSREAQNYGDAGDKPQVVWPNGVLASTAVGTCIQLLTGWSSPNAINLRMDYQGSTGHVKRSNVLEYIDCKCSHYPLSQAGNPVFTTV